VIRALRGGPAHSGVNSCFSYIPSREILKASRRGEREKSFKNVFNEVSGHQVRFPGVASENFDGGKIEGYMRRPEKGLAMV